MSEQTIKPGQRWRTPDGTREYVIEAYDARYDDCLVWNPAKRRRRKIFGSYLRRDYLLATEPPAST